MPAPQIPSLPGYSAGAQPIDPSQLCWEDYSSLVLLPVLGEAIAPFKDQGPDPVGMCRAGYRAIFWYCWNNEWPCCGEETRIDSCWARAEEVMHEIFEQDINQAAKPAVIEEILAQGLDPSCATPAPRAPRARARRSGGVPLRSRARRAGRRRARVG